MLNRSRNKVHQTTYQDLSRSLHSQLLSWSNQSCNAMQFRHSLKAWIWIWYRTNYTLHKPQILHWQRHSNPVVHISPLHESFPHWYSPEHPGTYFESHQGLSQSRAEGKSAPISQVSHPFNPINQNSTGGERVHLFIYSILREGWDNLVLYLMSR